jgi:ABC-2 type transport system permease protein
VLKFWRNPEFVRHVRSELRPARAITVALVVMLLCVLIGLACWSAQQNALEMAEANARQFGGQWIDYARRVREHTPRQTWRLIAQWMFGLQAGLLSFWSLMMCAQSVSGERDRKTWDFQRTTSLTSVELAIGKVLGEPVLAYFAALCALPFTVIAALGAGFTVWNTLNALTGIFASALFFGVCGLWMSIMVEHRSRSAGLLGALMVFGLSLGTYGLTASWFPGLAAFDPFVDLYRILELKFDYRGYVAPMLFGHAVPWLLMSLLIYASFGAWLAVMIVRNLKRDYGEIRLLSRWQSVGCAAFLNFVLYALFTSRDVLVKSDVLASFLVAINGIFLFVIGLASLTPPERLKVWWRERAEGRGGFFSADGLPWPWLVLSAAVAYTLMVWGQLAWRFALDFHASSLRTAGLQLAVVLVFVTRDILFIQWCTLTRLRQPVLKGILFLCLYYASAGVVVALCSISGESASMAALNVLTPTGVFQTTYGWGHYSGSLYGGLALQAGLIGMILVAISHRLGRPSLVAAVSEG